MRGINYKKQGASVKVIHKGDEDLSCWKFTLTDGLVALDAVDKEVLVDDFYKATITLDDEDYWYLLKWGAQTEILMVGDAEIVSWLYTGVTDGAYNYKQIALDDGESLKDEDMLEAGEGFYYIEPTLEASIGVFADSLIATLTTPYVVVNCTDGNSGETTADKNFINTGFNTMGYLGERNSYFDLAAGQWKNDDEVEAKASDLAKAVCHKYGLVWDDDEDEKWIGNYMKYLRTYEENSGKIRYYKVAVTPEDNDANFSLMQTDEDGNTVVKGISLLLTQTLETVNDTDGAIITFREES